MRHAPRAYILQISFFSWAQGRAARNFSQHGTDYPTIHRFMHSHYTYHSHSEKEHTAL